MSFHESVAFDVATLTQLSDGELWTSALSANSARRRATALLLAHLAVIEARELHVLRGYSSMFDFCVRGLGMSEGTAHRAISGTRAAHRYPLVLEMLADGRLHLSGLSLLSPHLTAENHAKLLEEAAGKTKAGIREVLARWFPKPDVSDRVQPLSPNRSGEQGQLGLDGAPRPRVEPLSEERFGVHFTGSARLRAKLEHARNLMSHVSRDLEVVFERALDALIRELENKQWGKTDRPRRSRGTKDGRPTRADKREVFERDDGQCAFVSEDGVRCASKAFLQYDHIQPRALGGSGKADESRLLCQQHNLMSAKQVFGRDAVERQIDLRQQKLEQREPGEERDLRQQKSQPSEPDPAEQKRQKLLAALVAQGFKKTESKKAVAKLARDATTLSLEQLIRRALELLVSR